MWRVGTLSDSGVGNKRARSRAVGVGEDGLRRCRRRGGPRSPCRAGPGLSSPLLPGRRPWGFRERKARASIETPLGLKHHVQ